MNIHLTQKELIKAIMRALNITRTEFKSRYSVPKGALDAWLLDKQEAGYKTIDEKTRKSIEADLISALDDSITHVHYGNRLNADYFVHKIGNKSVKFPIMEAFRSKQSQCLIYVTHYSTKHAAITAAHGVLSVGGAENPVKIINLENAYYVVWLHKTPGVTNAPVVIYQYKCIALDADGNTQIIKKEFTLNNHGNVINI